MGGRFIGTSGYGTSVGADLSLVTSAMRQFAEHFQVVLFRSLRDTPSCEALLEECLQLLAPQSLEVHCLNKNLPRRFLDPRRISSPQLFHVSRNTPGTTNAKQLVPPRQKPTNGTSWEEEKDSW